MTLGAVTVTEATPAREIAHLMYAKNIKRVSVVRDGQLVGIVARSDLIRALALKPDETPAAQRVGPRTVNEALRSKREETGP
jgi:CBS domain-containing protein